MWQIWEQLDHVDEIGIRTIRFRLRYSPSGSSLVVSADLSTLPSRRRSSQRTQRWREQDSNHRSLPRGIALAAAQRGGMPVGHLGMTPWPRGKAPRSIGVDKAAASR